MDDIDLLPDDLKKKSLLKKEIVLSFDDALVALDILVKKNWAPIAWEGLVKYPDGRFGFTHEVQGTIPMVKSENESWDEFVTESAKFLRDTMQEDQQRFNKDPRYSDLTFYFCISAIPQKDTRGKS